MADQNKCLLGLLNGLVRCDFYNDVEITENFLKEELYPEASNEEYESILHKARGLIKSMASSNMDTAQAESFLTSQAKKKDGGITESQAKVYMKFWRNNKQQIHQRLVDRSTWNNRLENLSWRIDVNSRARNVDQLNSATAIVELQLSLAGKPKDTDVVRFEMDEENLGQVVQSLKDIEHAISLHTSSDTKT